MLVVTVKGVVPLCMRETVRLEFPLVQGRPLAVGMGSCESLPETIRLGSGRSRVKSSLLELRCRSEWQPRLTHREA